MTNITLSIPKKHKAFIDAHPEINWSECARKGIENQIVNLALNNTIEIIIKKKPSRS